MASCVGKIYHEIEYADVEQGQYDELRQLYEVTSQEILPYWVHFGVLLLEEDLSLDWKSKDHWGDGAHQGQDGQEEQEADYRLPISHLSIILGTNIKVKPTYKQGHEYALNHFRPYKHRIPQRIQHRPSQQSLHSTRNPNINLPKGNPNRLFLLNHLPNLPCLKSLISWEILLVSFSVLYVLVMDFGHDEVGGVRECWAG